MRFPSHPTSTGGRTRALAQESRGFTSFRVVLVCLYIVSAVLLLSVLVRGWSFYVSSSAARVDHAGYWLYKPGGQIGIRLGIAGSSLMVLMLLYSVRKRVRVLRKLGPLPRWLDLHIFCGIIGPLCIVVHSSFKVQGLVAISFWSMVGVGLSGVLGRYLYLQIPRNRAGEELALGELESLNRSLTERLRNTFRLSDEQLERLDTLLVPRRSRPSAAGDLWSLVVLDLRRRSRLRTFIRACPSVPLHLARDFERIAHEKARISARIRLWNRVHDLFHYWHVLHKPFAAVMYLFMLLHIAVALMTGYAW